MPLRMTCPNQTFFTGFACDDFSISLYMMNFKKGSQITHEKLMAENKKTKSVYLVLPLNHDDTFDSEATIIQTRKPRVPGPIRDNQEKPN